MLSKILHFKTSLQILSTHISIPSILMFPPRIFGCVSFVHLHKNQCTKLDPCAVRCLFLGYGLHKKMFPVLWPHYQPNLYYHGCYVSWVWEFLSFTGTQFFPSGGDDSSLAVAVAMAPFDLRFDPRQRRHLIRAHLVSQLIRVQLVLLDWGSDQQNL